MERGPLDSRLGLREREREGRGREGGEEGEGEEEGEGGRHHVCAFHIHIHTQSVENAIGHMPTPYTHSLVVFGVSTDPLVWLGDSMLGSTLTEGVLCSNPPFFCDCGGVRTSLCACVCKAMLP